MMFERLRSSIRVYFAPSKSPGRDIFIYVVPIVFMLFLFAIYSNLEGTLTETMLDLGGVELQQMPWVEQYIIFVWGMFFPTILLIFPVYYFTITRTIRTTLDLFIEAIGLFIFAGVFQDWLVFAFSKRLTLTETGSVFENLFGSPIVMIAGHQTPVYYFVFLAFSIGIICFSMRDFWYLLAGIIRKIGGQARGE